MTFRKGGHHTVASGQASGSCVEASRKHKGTLEVSEQSLFNAYCAMYASKEIITNIDRSDAVLGQMRLSLATPGLAMTNTPVFDEL